MSKFLLMALFGIVGLFCRYFLDQFLSHEGSRPSYISTGIINFLGCFIAGLLFAYFSSTTPDPAKENLRLILFVGFLGCFTTFSAFSIDILKLMEQKQNATALIYLFSSPLLNCFAAFLGFSVIKYFI